MKKLFLITLLLFCYVTKKINANEVGEDYSKENVTEEIQEHYEPQSADTIDKNKEIEQKINSNQAGNIALFIIAGAQIAIVIGFGIELWK